MSFFKKMKALFSVDTILPETERLGQVAGSREMYREYIKLAWPASMQGLLLQLMTAIDLAMVGVLGAEALAAVGIMSQPKMIMLVFVRAFAVAMTAMVARRYGQKEYADMNGIVKQGIMITAFVYIPLLLCVSYFLDEILFFSGAEISYLLEARTYGNLLTLSLFFAAFTQIIGAALIGVGHTKTLFNANVIGTVLNTVLNYFLIYGVGIFPAMGIAGAGWATVISSAVILLLLLRSVMKSSGALRLFDGQRWRFKREDIHVMRHLSASALGEQIFERFGMFAYTKMVAGLGVIPLATHHVCMNLCDIFYSFSLGMGYAGASQTGRYLGANRPDLAKAFGHIGVRVGMIMATASFFIYLLIRQSFMRLYTSDEAVIQLGAEIIVYLAIASFPQVLQLVYAGVLKGAGDNFYVMKYSLIVIAIIRPIVTYVLCFPLGMGLHGAWLALFLDQTLRMLCAGHRFYQGKWQHIKV